MSSYKNMGQCDLRNIQSVEAAKSINEIKNIGVLIIPIDAPDDVMSAIESIPKMNIGSVLRLNKNDKLMMCNGSCVFNKNSFIGDNDVYIINGFAVVESADINKKVKIMLNGVMLIKESEKANCNFEFLQLNGMTTYADFETVKQFPNKILVDAEFLSYLKNKTAVVAGNKIEIAKDVTKEMLQEKEIVIVAGNKIVCDKSILAYLKATAIFGNKINTWEEQAEIDKNNNDNFPFDDEDDDDEDDEDND